MAWNKPNFGTGASFNFKFDRQEDEDARGETPEAGGFFFFSIRAPLAAQASSLALSSAHLKNWKEKKRRLFHWVNGFFLRHGLEWHTTLSKVYRELRKNFQVGKMVNLSSSCLCLILFTNMTLIVIVWLYASHICMDLMITHRRVSAAQWQSSETQNPKIWRSIPRGDNFFVPCSRRGEWTSFSSSFQFFFIYFESVLTLRPIAARCAMRLITKLTRIEVTYLPRQFRNESWKIFFIHYWDLLLLIMLSFE